MSGYLLLFLLMISAVAVAQEEAEEVLDPIQVTAKKIISDFNFSQPTFIGPDALESGPFGLVSRELSQIPGVIANQNGGPGARVSYFIRGTESRHVAYTLDGLKMNDPSNVDRQYDAAFFSSPFLKQVEIHKGPQAVLYGSDSLGGLVEMTSRKGENAPETRLSLNVGSFGTIDSALSHDWKSTNNTGTLTVYKFRTDGISRLNKKRFDAIERDGSDITQLSSSSSHQWTTKLETDLLVSYLQGKNELDGNSRDNSQDKSQNDQYLLQQKTNLRVSKTSAFSLRSGLNRHTRLIHSQPLGFMQVDSFEGGLIQNEGLFKFQENDFTLISGLATEHEQLNISGLDKSFDLHSFFLQGALKFSTLRLQSGVRAERHVRYGSFYTGSSGLALDLGRNIFSIQYSKGFKAPSLFQLYEPTFGNSSLVPEANHTWEAGWNLSDKLFEGGVTLFQNRLSNLITFNMVNGYVNQSRFIAEGIEVSGKWKQPGVHFLSSFTHQEFREEESVVLRRPLNSVMGGVAVFPTDSSELSLKGKWFSNRKDQDENQKTVVLNGYEVFDLGARYIFATMDVGIQVLNLLNREYEELYGYSVMPRSLFVHSGFRF